MDQQNQTVSLSHGEFELLCKMGVMKPGMWPNSLYPDGARWGVTFRGIGEREHTLEEIAVHEAGHVVGALSSRIRFEFVQLPVTGRQNSGVKSLDADLELQMVPSDQLGQNIFYHCLIAACGPVATSVVQYGNPLKWENCGNDVMELALTELRLEFPFIDQAVKGAIKVVDSSWQVISGIATKLKDSTDKKLTYDDCFKIAHDIDPIPRNVQL